jgi:hypothetical protein
VKAVSQRFSEPMTQSIDELIKAFDSLSTERRLNKRLAGLKYDNARWSSYNVVASRLARRS